MKTRLGRGWVNATVLDAPRESFAPEQSWRGRSPAPAGALYRGEKGFAAEASHSDESEDEPEFKPRRFYGLRWSRLLRSTGGRILVALLIVVATGSAAATALVARRFALHQPAFVLSTSENIEIEGNQHLTREQALEVFAPDLERSIFLLPLAQRRADLERLPWVERATVMRLLPNRIRVAVVERTPVAFVRQGTQIGLIDAHGALLDIPTDAVGDPRDSFPVVTGISSSDPLPLRTARMSLYEGFMAALASGGRTATNSISEVDLSNPEDVQAVVTGGGGDVLVHFGQDHYLERYKQFAAHLAGWRLQFPRLASADMRYPGQVVLDMQPGMSAPPANQPAKASVSPGLRLSAVADTSPTLSSPPLKSSAIAARPSVSTEPRTARGGKAAETHARSATHGTVPRSSARPKVLNASDRQRAANERMFAELAAAHRASLAGSGKELRSRTQNGATHP